MAAATFITVRVLRRLPRLEVGTIHQVELKVNGLVRDSLWAKLLSNAKEDNSLEIVPEIAEQPITELPEITEIVETETVSVTKKREAKKN